MNYFFYIRKLFIVSLLMLVIQKTQGQFASGVADYLPAPGQYTNADFIGTPTAANSLIGTNRGLLSLGAYGGSITLEFASAIKNDPNNSYGVDFTIYGNPTTTWSEPGIIQVMKDENKNGLPDDTWYEIAGSDHYWSTTISNYEITYLSNGSNSRGDIHWTDNQGKSGFIPENSFHRQSYYPQADLFSNIPSDKFILNGTRIPGQIDLSIPGVVNSYRRGFGYADNTPVISTTEKLPDNPYTKEIEGSGGDAIDIEWAVDKQKNHVKLDEIHFIRIYTGMNALAGWLGEISTEITGIRDVEPSMVNGPRSMVVIQDLPPKIRMGEMLNVTALFFESGIKIENANINWTVSNPELAVIENGELKTLKNGVFRLRASSITNPVIYAEKELEIVKSLRDSIQISILPESAMKKVFISVKTTERTLVPRHSIRVESTDLTSSVDKAQKTYQLNDTSFVSLAHAIYAMYKNTGLENEWAFRDDTEGGSALYLWRIPEMEEGSVSYHLGYGGSRTLETHRKTWIVMLNQQPIVSGLDKVKVNNDDEILVYQIADNQTPWSVTHLTSGPDTLKVSQKVDIQLMKYFCSMNQDRSVSVNSSEVLAYQTVQIELKNSTKSGNTYTTDEFGKLAITLDKVGEYLFVSGIDASKLFVESVTGNSPGNENRLSCNIYPNPFTDHLRIDCSSIVKTVEIVDLNGRIVYSEPYSKADLQLRYLPSGFYIIKIKSGNQIFQHKLIKQ